VVGTPPLFFQQNFERDIVEGVEPRHWRARDKRLTANGGPLER
jgi:hypothetical protein